MLKIVMLAGLMLLIVIVAGTTRLNATRHRGRNGDAATGLFPPAE